MATQISLSTATGQGRSWNFVSLVTLNPFTIQYDSRSTRHASLLGIAYGAGEIPMKHTSA